MHFLAMFPKCPDQGNWGLSPVFSDSGVLTPVDPPSRVGSAIIAVDQAMEVDKAESILVKRVVCVLVVVLL